MCRNPCTVDAEEKRGCDGGGGIEEGRPETTQESAMNKSEELFQVVEELLPKTKMKLESSVQRRKNR